MCSAHEIFCLSTRCPPPSQPWRRAPSSQPRPRSPPSSSPTPLPTWRLPSPPTFFWPLLPRQPVYRRMTIKEDNYFATLAFIATPSFSSFLSIVSLSKAFLFSSESDLRNYDNCTKCHCRRNDAFHSPPSKLGLLLPLHLLSRVRLRLLLLPELLLRLLLLLRFSHGDLIALLCRMSQTLVMLCNAKAIQ